MSSKAGSSFATLLLSLPLVVLPLMAIFGIPQFAPLAASSNLRSDGSLPPAAASDLYRSRAADVLGNDPYGGNRFQTDTTLGDSSQAPLWNDMQASAATSAPPVVDLFGASPTPGANGTAAPRNGMQASANPNAPRGGRLPLPSDLMSTPSGQQPAAGGAATLTWTEATRRLSELGIENYHLERGSKHDSFLFVCWFSPGDNPVITQRFERESTDPLLAVQDVLDQIDRWLRQRFAAEMHSGSNPTAMR